MIGIGSLSLVANALPFIFVFTSPIIFKRYNALGINPYGNSRNYYKRFWFRFLFGRFQFIFYGVGGTYFLIHHLKSKNDEKQLLLEFTAFLDEIEAYNEEESKAHGKALRKYRYNKKMEESRDLVLDGRSELHRISKIEAFELFENELNQRKENQI